MVGSSQPRGPRRGRPTKTMAIQREICSNPSLSEREARNRVNTRHIRSVRLSSRLTSTFNVINVIHIAQRGAEWQRKIANFALLLQRDVDLRDSLTEFSHAEITRACRIRLRGLRISARNDGSPTQGIPYETNPTASIVYDLTQSPITIQRKSTSNTLLHMEATEQDSSIPMGSRNLEVSLPSRDDFMGLE